MSSQSFVYIENLAKIVKKIYKESFISPEVTITFLRSVYPCNLPSKKWLVFKLELVCSITLKINFVQPLHQIISLLKKVRKSSLDCFRKSQFFWILFNFFCKPSHCWRDNVTKLELAMRLFCYMIRINYSPFKWQLKKI